MYVMLDDIMWRGNSWRAPRQSGLFWVVIAITANILPLKTKSDHKIKRKFCNKSSSSPPQYIG